MTNKELENKVNVLEAGLHMVIDHVRNLEKSILEIVALLKQLNKIT